MVLILQKQRMIYLFNVFKHVGVSSICSSTTWPEETGSLTNAVLPEGPGGPAGPGGPGGPAMVKAA